jgi:hypothetical protein
MQTGSSTSQRMEAAPMPPSAPAPHGAHAELLTEIGLRGRKIDGERSARNTGPASPAAATTTFVPHPHLPYDDNFLFLDSSVFYFSLLCSFRSCLGVMKNRKCYCITITYMWDRTAPISVTRQAHLQPIFEDYFYYGKFIEI